MDEQEYRRRLWAAAWNIAMLLVILGLPGWIAMLNMAPPWSGP